MRELIWWNGQPIQPDLCTIPYAQASEGSCKGVGGLLEHLTCRNLQAVCSFYAIARKMSSADYKLPNSRPPYVFLTCGGCLPLGLCRLLSLLHTPLPAAAAAMALALNGAVTALSRALSGNGRPAQRAAVASSAAALSARRAALVRSPVGLLLAGGRCTGPLRGAAVCCSATSADDVVEVELKVGRWIGGPPPCVN